MKKLILIALVLILSACELTQPPSLPPQTGWICNPSDSTTEPLNTNEDEYICTGFNGIYKGKVKERTLSDRTPIPYGDDLYQLTDKDRSYYLRPHGLGNFKKLNTDDNFYLDGSFKDGRLIKGSLSHDINNKNFKFKGSFKSYEWTKLPLFHQGTYTITSHTGNQSIKSGVFVHNWAEFYLKTGTAIEKFASSNDDPGCEISWSGRWNSSNYISGSPVIIKHPAATIKAHFKNGQPSPGIMEIKTKDYVAITKWQSNKTIFPESLSIPQNFSFGGLWNIDQEGNAIINAEIMWDDFSCNSKPELIDKKVILEASNKRYLVNKTALQFDDQQRLGFEIYTKAPENWDDNHKKDSQILLIETIDKEVNREVTKVEDVNSSYRSDYREVYNPKYDQAVIRVQNARDRLYSAQANSQRYPVLCGQTGSTPQGFSCLIAKTAVITAQTRYNEAVASLSSTSRMIKEPVMESYTFRKIYIDATKESTTRFNLIVSKDRRFQEKIVSTTDDKKFIILDKELPPTDKNRSSHVKGTSTETDIEAWLDEQLLPEYDSLSELIPIIMSDGNVKEYDLGMIQLTTNQEKKGPKINGNFAYPQLEECPGSQSNNRNWTNCKGTYNFTSGSRYVGEYQDGKRTGQGTLTWASGSKYIGDFKDNKRTGQGTLTWANGNQYTGDFKDGRRTGQGTYTYSNGDQYVGGFKDSKRHGQGTMTYANGDQYIGEYKDGERHGQGTYYTWTNGRVKETGKSMKANEDVPIYDYEESVVIIEDLQGGLGTGFYVRDVLIITNQHVVGDRKYMTIKNKEGESFTGHVLETDLGSDLAVLTTTQSGKPLELKPGCSVKKGEVVTTIGHPSGYEYSLTKGIISSVRTMDNPFIPGAGKIEYIQIDAPINPGNSGGPLIDSNGYVVGVNTWGARGDNLGFSIHCSEVEEFLKKYVP